MTRISIDALLDDDFDIESLTAEEAAELARQLEAAVGDVWALTPRQLYAEAIGERVDWMLYGGAAGAGKSELSCYHANKLSLAIPGHMSLMLRRTIPELRRSLIIRLIARIGRYAIPAKYRKLDGQAGFQYKNGSLIECGHMQTEEAIAKYLGSEYDLIVIDESTTLSDEQIVQVQSRLRTTNEKARLGARPHLWCLTNPGGMSHAWHYEMFITPTEYGQKIVTYNVTQGLDKRILVAEHTAPIPVADATDVEVVDVLLPWARSLELPNDPNLLTVAFVPARATHNPHIDPGYMRSLNTLSERRRRQLRDGDWDTFEGMYFTEYSRDVHVIRPFEIPESWQRARGIDWGQAAPYACLWGAWDEDGNCYVYREDYAANLTPQEQARRIIERSVRWEGERRVPEKFRHTVADPAVFADRRGAGKSIADMWRDAGLHTTRAKNDRIGGWTNIRQYLWDYEREAPRLFIFDTCRDLTRTLPLMQYDKTNTEDMATKNVEDHLCVAAETLVTTRRGQVRIDAIAPGDEVLVGDGTYERVLWAGQTADDASLWQLGPLVATGEHLVWTTRGFVPMHSVMHYDTLNAWLIPSSSHPPARSTPGSGTTSAATTSSETESGCIAWSGQMQTDPSPKGSTFTTSTTTDPTTGSPTSPSCTDETTQASTVGNRPPLVERLDWHPSPASSPGTPSSPAPSAVRQLVEAGKFTTSPSSGSSSARSAGSSTSPRSPLAPSSAATTARLARSERAAVPLGRTAPVFNLLTEGPRHEFYADGILVHNCDALRYLLATRPISDITRRERRPVTLDEKFAAKLRGLDKRRRRW